MPAIAAFDRALTQSEQALIASLNTPNKIQHFLDELSYSTDEFYRCPLRVLRERSAIASTVPCSPPPCCGDSATRL